MNKSLILSYMQMFWGPLTQNLWYSEQMSNSKPELQRVDTYKYIYIYKIPFFFHPIVWKQQKQTCLCTVSVPHHALWQVSKPQSAFYSQQSYNLCLLDFAHYSSRSPPLVWDSCLLLLFVRLPPSGRFVWYWAARFSSSARRAIKIQGPCLSEGRAWRLPKTNQVAFKA